MNEVKQFVPPANVAENARRALEVRASKPQSQRGMTLVGLARANQLANRRPVSEDTLRRMVAYFDRHEVDKDGETWNDKGKGWQAWYGWGGDEGRTWAQRMLRQITEETKQMDKRLVIEMVDGMFNVYTSDNEEEVVHFMTFQEMMTAMMEMFDIPQQQEMEDTQEDVVEDTMEDAPMEDMQSEKVELTTEERNALPDNDFAIPETRNFPVVIPQDVADAVASWGRYQGDVSFEVFKRNLIALARRKGEEFVAMLPQAWKDEMEEATKTVARAILQRIG